MTTNNVNLSEQQAWFAIKCQNHKDRLVLEYLRKHADKILQVEILVDHSYVTKTGSKKPRNLSPGVVFAKIALVKGQISNDLRKWIISVPYVKGFKNYLTKTFTDPVAFSPQMIANIMISHNVKTVKVGKYTKEEVGFVAGDYLLVLRGVFVKYEGELIKIDYNTGILTLNTEFFGRMTTIEVNFSDCKKVIE